MTVHQEYAGGMVAEFEVDLPAVLGVQTSREAPRYAPVSRVRQLMKTATIEQLECRRRRPAAASSSRRWRSRRRRADAEMIGGRPGGHRGADRGDPRRARHRKAGAAR